jgi:predicted RNA-binding protein with PIN domain
MDYIIVDGYNIIGASLELSALRDQNLEEARHQLQERLSEYSAYTGRKVIIVYDAHLTKGTAKKNRLNNIEICFTEHGVTADEYIEKTVVDIIRQANKVYVATSDALEQRLVFGKGALRLSARELLLDIKVVHEQIVDEISKSQQKQTRIKGVINQEIARVFEDWRRK